MTFFQKSGKLIKQFDLFGTPISLNLDKKTHYQSYLGAIISILSLLLITTLCWNIFIDYLNQANLLINTQNEYNPNPSMLELNQDNFFFAVNIQQNDNLSFASVPYFAIQVEQGHVQNTSQSKNQQFSVITMQKCQQQDLKNLDQDVINTINSIGIQNLICPSTNFKITLQGQQTSQIFEFLKISVIQCDENNKAWDFDRCATSAELSQFQANNQQFKVTIYHTNYSINLNKMGTFYYKYLSEELSFSFVPQKVFKQNDVFFKPVHIQSDDNSLINQSYDNIDLIIQDYQDVKENFILDSTNKEYQISYIRRSPETISMKRQYQKFSNVMIQFGGLIKFVITVAGFFVTKYNSFQFTIEIANKLYNFNFSSNLKNVKSQQELMDNKKTQQSIIQNPKEHFKIKKQSIQMVALKQDLIYEKESKQASQIIENERSIFKAISQKQPNQKSESPKITPRSLKNIQDIEDNAQQQSNDQKQSKLQVNGNGDKIGDEQVQKQQININLNFEAKSKIVKEDPLIQRIAQKFQHQRKDSVKQLQLFQENIQNQYYTNIKKKKQSVFNNCNAVNNQQNELQEIGESPIVNKNGNENIFKHQDSIMNKPTFIQSSNIIQNLVYFKEIGFKNKKDFLVEQFRIIINRSKKITAKIWYFLRLITCGKCFNTEENFLIEKAREYAQKDLDIYIILDKLQEIEKIKKILLDENQLILFNFSQKPLIQKNDDFLQTLSLRNLQIKHRKSETLSNRNKMNSINNTASQQESLFCKKLQYDNIEAYEKLHKAYENIRPYHLQDKVSRQLVKELGTELREIFELSKIIEGQSDNTPKSTPIRNASKTQYENVGSKHLEDLDLNQIMKQKQNSKNSLHLCDGIYSSAPKLPSKNQFVNECLSPEEKPIDENITSHQKNPYIFTSSSTNKPGRLSIFNNMKGAYTQDSNQPIEEKQSYSDSESSEDSDSSKSKSKSSEDKSHASNQQTKSSQKQKPKIDNIQEEFLDSNLSNSQYNNQKKDLDLQICMEKQSSRQDNQLEQPKLKSQNQSGYDLSKSFKNNLAQISLNQSLFVYDVDLENLNNSQYKQTTEANLKEQDSNQKDFYALPDYPNI
ncbi:transmembrane protein, putative (macronuclear) [Tetrahymena thermophila SB210]|uniref:Transmembrane protein, putative n=1 Tax=Tetrahymena thermophila (strain SB210) TaxID=312017 RepID=I7M954_TETTS|nr:transmembrane protein, putative [Tetrahymena thermophila SB210]EAS00815.2 transmembrane protein, putative [Tetrahymena thermophila SB210]|eukprot:XP_001021060.2 transmembrane protein, putative [Tetrahymena thermophila SB210]